MPCIQCRICNGYKRLNFSVLLPDISGIMFIHTKIKEIMKNSSELSTEDIQKLHTVRLLSDKSFKMRNELRQIESEIETIIMELANSIFVGKCILMSDEYQVKVQNIKKVERQIGGYKITGSGEMIKKRQCCIDWPDVPEYSVYENNGFAVHIDENFDFCADDVRFIADDEFDKIKKTADSLHADLNDCIGNRISNGDMVIFNDANGNLTCGIVKGFDNSTGCFDVHYPYHKGTNYFLKGENHMYLKGAKLAISRKVRE